MSLRCATIISQAKRKNEDEVTFEDQDCRNGRIAPISKVSMKPLTIFLEQYRLILFLFVLYLFCSSQARSQTFSIPDVNFRNCLKETYPHIFNSNDELIIAAAQGITHISCSEKGIQNIEGIGYFGNLEWLGVSHNELQAIPNLTALTKLKGIQAASNQLTACPDLSGNIALQWINFYNNRITVFPDISNNPNLYYVDFTGNQLQGLSDLSANTALVTLLLENNPLQSLPDLSHNINLEFLNISRTGITVFPDLSHNTNLQTLVFGNNPQLSAFPDLTRNTKLITINCSYNGLTAIPDLSVLTALAHFQCHGNKLTSLPDLSKNTNLISLYCFANALSQLPDLSKCPMLQYIYCETNNLTALPDLSNNTQLAYFTCNDNNLTSLPDLSNTKIGKAAASVFSAAYNMLTFDDILPLSGPVTAVRFEYGPQKKISGNTTREVTSGDPFIIDLDIDDHVTDNVYTWYKDNTAIATTGSNIFTIDQVKASGLVLETGTITLTIGSPLGWIADDNFRACLKEAYPWAFNSQDYIMLDKAAIITEITCVGKGIKDISGIEFFSSVRLVYLGKNQISEVPQLSTLANVNTLSFYENNISALPDLSACTLLQRLEFSHNNFSTFPDVTSNADMRFYDFGHNHITSIPDLSVYPRLSGLIVSYNPIETLPDLRNNSLLVYLAIDGTNLKTFPDLSGIESLSHLRFGHNPQFSTWPANFPTTENLSTIECAGNGLSVIPSLNQYPKLAYLDCSSNNLTALPDLSSNRELVALDCSDNKLTSLPDFYNQTKFQWLACNNNDLHSLPDLSHTRLGSSAYTTGLWVAGNHLTFEDLAPVIIEKTYTELIYSPQTLVGINQVVTKDKNDPFVIDLNIDDAMTNNVYKWYRDGVLVSTTSANTLTISSVQPAHAGVYICVVTNPGVPGLELAWGKITLDVNTIAPPWTPVTGGTGNHIVVIPDNAITDIYGAPIQAGDYIGVFFKDAGNTLQLSGSAKWSGTSTAITVWSRSEQGAKNGFDAAEQMIIRIWKAGEQKSYTMSATYDQQLPYTDQGNFRVNGFSRILTMSVQPVCHRIDLYAGWNLISSYVKATDLSMAGIFRDAGSTVVVKDASGRILYAPEFGITNGTWNIAEGYMVYSSTKQFFEVCGRPVDSETPISLVKNSYPAFLPYYGNVEVPASAALAGLGTNYSYAQAITYAEGTGQPQAFNYIPAHVINPPIDQIGNMRPGLAYKILLQNNVPAFRYPAHISSAGGRLKDADAALIATTHFKTAQPNTVNNAVLVIPHHIFGSTLVAGDEIGVFSGTGRLIGAMTYQGTSMAITLWEHETSGTADAFTVRLWHAKVGEESPVNLTFANGGEGRFVPNTLLVANGAEVRRGEEFSETVKVYPNPAANDLQFTVRVAGESTVRIMLYDMMGRERGQLLNKVLAAGVHHETLDVSAFPAGQYFYKVDVNNAVTSNKLVIVK
jgi:hypothetical protein